MELWRRMVNTNVRMYMCANMCAAFPSIWVRGQDGEGR
jgi:hypothetical protein